MLVMALDLAVSMGWAIGRAGEKPRAGSERLKRPDDPSQRACKKLGIWLRDQFAFEIPDLVVVEAPVNIGGLIDWKKDSGEKPSFRSNPETISLLHRLVGGVETLCGPYGVRCVSANVQTVRKHVVGKARPEEPKKAVLARCKMLGYLPKDFTDTDASDAVALHIYASDVICRVKPAELVLFGEN
jgi:hypothetical protein